jgi:hypothetical protein
MDFFPMVPAVMVPVAGMIFVGAIVITPMVLRSQERQRMHNTLRRLHEEGQTITPEMLQALTPDDPWSRVPQSATSDLRRGLILMAVALGMVCLGFAIGMGGPRIDPVWPLIGAAAFPGLIGVAFLFMWMFKLNNTKV